MRAISLAAFLLTAAFTSLPAQAPTASASEQEVRALVAKMFDAMRDGPRVARMIRDCKDALLGQEALRLEHHVAELLDGIRGRVRGDRPRETQRAAFERYAELMRKSEPAHWRRTRAAGALRGALVALGARRLKRALFARAGSRA